jgi:UDP-N-acetyl-D-galactosamine dehydrogenase
VVEIVEQLQKYHAQIDVYDPWVDPAEAIEINQLLLVAPQTASYDLVVLAVAHDQFMQTNPRAYLKEGGLLFDLKGLLPEDWVDERL